MNKDQFQGMVKNIYTWSFDSLSLVALSLKYHKISNVKKGNSYNCEG